MPSVRDAQSSRENKLTRQGRPGRQLHGPAYRSPRCNMIIFQANLARREEAPLSLKDPSIQHFEALLNIDPNIMNVDDTACIPSIEMPY